MNVYEHVLPEGILASQEFDEVDSYTGPTLNVIAPLEVYVTVTVPVGHEVEVLKGHDDGLVIAVHKAESEALQHPLPTVKHVEA